MSNISYSIAIDRNHDGIFEDDITPDVIEAHWSLGLAQPYDSIADFSQADIIVHNPDGNYSPERNPLDAGTRVRIQSNDGTTTYTHFVGFIAYVKPSTGEWGDQIAIIHLQDVQVWLENSSVTIAPQANVTADEVINTLLDEAILRRAILNAYCIIDIASYNMINTISIFPADNITRHLDAGKTVFAYVGDWWGETLPARQGIRELVTSTRGRFYINRHGEVVFLNRHYTLITQTQSASFNDDMRELDYRYGDNRLNHISIIMTPRTVGENNTILWQLQSPQRHAQNTQVTLRLRFLDAQQQPIGMLNFGKLNTAFNTSADGQGATVIHNVSVDILQIGFTSMQIRIRNDNPYTVYLTNLTVTGKPLYRQDPLEVVVSDGEGMHLYGLQRAVLNLPALSDIETAHAFAQYELSRRKHPQGTIRTLTTTPQDHPTHALSLTLFDRIHITETHSGHTAQDYFIIGEAHHVSTGGAHHHVTWTLEPADSQRFVIINDSTINDSTKVLTPY